MLTIFGGGDTITQMIFPYHSTGNPLVRSGNPPEVGVKGSYGSWRKLAFMDDITTNGVKTKTYSNANGSALQIGNDLLICYGNFHIKYNTTIKSTNTLDSGSITYPAKFTGVAPSVNITFAGTDIDTKQGGDAYVTMRYTNTLHASFPYSGFDSNSSFPFSYIAIGKPSKVI